VVVDSVGVQEVVVEVDSVPVEVVDSEVVVAVVDSEVVAVAEMVVAEEVADKPSDMSTSTLPLMRLSTPNPE